MSNIADAYDIIISELTAEFVGKTRIPNAYALEINNMMLLKNGWGLRVNEASKQNLSYCRRSMQRSFSVVVTREILRLESDQVLMDDSVVNLLEDIVLAEQRIYNATTLLDQINGVTKVDLTDSTGISFVITENHSFAFMELNFIIVTEEDYNN